MRPFPPGTFDPERKNTVPGRILNAIYQALRERTPVAGTGVQLRELDGGFQISGSAASTPEGGAFYRMFKGDQNRTYLQGGCLTITGRMHIFPDYWVIDPITGPRGAEGDALVIRAAVKGYVVDGMLLPGLEMLGTPIITSPGSTVPTPLPPVRSPQSPRRCNSASATTPRQGSHPCTRATGGPTSVSRAATTKASAHDPI